MPIGQCEKAWSKVISRVSFELQDTVTTIRRRYNKDARIVPYVTCRPTIFTAGIPRGGSRSEASSSSRPTIVVASEISNCVQETYRWNGRRLFPQTEPTLCQFL